MGTELLIGLIAIALGIFFGLRGFGKQIRDDLAVIRQQTKPIEEIKNKTNNIAEKIVAMSNTLEKGWDIIQAQLLKAGTVEKFLDNLGKIRISAKPGKEKTTYTIEIQKPILNMDFIEKKSKETGFWKKEVEIFGQETKFTTLSPRKMLVHVPSNDPVRCTTYIATFMKWLDTNYFESLKEIQTFEAIDLD